MPRPQVLVVVAGAPGPGVRARHGAFDAWFGDLLSPHADVRLVDGRGPLPATPSRGGVVLTGSYASVTAREPWMEALGAWAIDASRSAGVLGVCFGHQLLAHALGGAVERNARGPEAGTAVVELTPAGRADPLFAGLPEVLEVQEMHEDHVPAPPPGAVLLAWNAHAPVQAFAAGPRLRAVQFHPEFDAERCRAIAEEERGWLERAGAGTAARALGSIRPTPDAARVLANWVEAYARP